MWHNLGDLDQMEGKNICYFIYKNIMDNLDVDMCYLMDDYI